LRTPPRFAITLPWLLIATLAAPVSRAASIDPAVVREAIEASWSERSVPGFSLEVRRVPTLTYHEGVAEVEPLFPDGPLHPGPRAIPVNLRVDGRVVARGLANILLRKRVTVWVPVRPVERGATITPADLRPEPRIYDRDPHRLFAGPGEGTWTARRDLEGGQVLRPSDLARKPDVAAGDTIILVSRAGDASVAVAGRVRRSGNVGDTILVLNPVTGSIVRAVLIDRGTAELVVPGRPGGRSAQ